MGRKQVCLSGGSTGCVKPDGNGERPKVDGGTAIIEPDGYGNG